MSDVQPVTDEEIATVRRFLPVAEAAFDSYNRMVVERDELLAERARVAVVVDEMTRQVTRIDERAARLLEERETLREALATIAAVDEPAAVIATWDPAHLVNLARSALCPTCPTCGSNHPKERRRGTGGGLCTGPFHSEEPSAPTMMTSDTPAAAASRETTDSPEAPIR